jgi:hypothetical protein
MNNFYKTGFFGLLTLLAVLVGYIFISYKQDINEKITSYKQDSDTKMADYKQETDGKIKDLVNKIDQISSDKKMYSSKD